MVEFGGALLPSQVDLDKLVVRKTSFGAGGPKVRLVVGSHYGRNTDGTSKPVRAFLEDRIILYYFPIFTSLIVCDHYF